MAFALLCAPAVTGGDSRTSAGARPGTDEVRSAGGIALAVLGDSDSHAYHDRLLLHSGDARARGGRFHDVTWQWTEVLARLRPGAIDLGEWGAWGRPSIVGRMRALLGHHDRMPRKEDYEHVFAIGGARCASLGARAGGQVPALLDVMARSPERWAGGLVVVRIGINDLGTEPMLEHFAARGLDQASQDAVQRCLAEVGQAVRAIRERHPSTRVLLVGILDNADWPRWHARWQSHEALSRIATVLDAYDAGLRALARVWPRVRFHDDRAWFRALWGGRDETGRPAYRSVALGGPCGVSMTEGDSPENAVLADGHAGTAWNALWAREIVRIVNEDFAANIVPIADDEIARLVDRDGAIGLRAR